MSKINLKTPLQKDFYKNFEYLTGRQDRRKVWEDFISISQQILDIHKHLENEPIPAHMQDFYRDEEWKRFDRMFTLTMDAIEENPDQDFLGDLYMRLRLANSSRGEVFTPYSVCQMMASTTIGGIEECIQKQGWASVYDPACGAGATLIAFANECSQREINFQKQILFVAQDIGWVVAGMCFVQLSMLGCGGYVVVGDTLAKPIVGPSLLRPIEQEGQEIWYTPTYYLPPWAVRVQIDVLKNIAFGKEGNFEHGSHEKANDCPAENHEEGGKSV